LFPSLAMSSRTYAKHFIPLESDPEIFTELAHNLGLPENFALHEVISLDEPDLLALIPRPVDSLILLFPADASKSYSAIVEAEQQKVSQIRDTSNHTMGGRPPED
jgi:ubiquitin carboxyl-terminal hydrolase L3